MPNPLSLPLAGVPVFSGPARKTPSPRFGNHATFEGDVFKLSTAPSESSPGQLSRLTAENQALARQVDLLTKLIHGTVHDARNALGNIMNYAELLDLDLEPQGETREFMDTLKWNATDLSGILMDLEGCSQPTLQRNEVILDSLQEMWAEEFRSFVHRKFPGTTFRFSPDPEPGTIDLDVTKMRRVMLNLVKNACEAMRDAETPNPQLDVSLRSKGDRLVLKVADNGPGFDRETLENKLFQDPFTTKTYGHGFGLMNCKQFVELHGGTLSVASAPGEGAVFSIELPAGE